jgi:hypothetical protein
MVVISHQQGKEYRQLEQFSLDFCLSSARCGRNRKWHSLGCYPTGHAKAIMVPFSQGIPL